MRSFAASLLTLLALPCIVFAQTNLAPNPRFAEPDAAGAPKGWSPLWARDAGAASMAVDSATAHDGAPALRVTSTGERDWAASTASPIAVKAGDIFRIAGWLRADKLDRAGLSLVTRNASGDTVAWTYAEAGTSGTHDWQRIVRRTVIPKGVTSVQLRLVGNGRGSVWLAEPELVRDGSIESAITGLAGKRLRMASAALNVAVDADTGVLHVTDRRSKRTWDQAAVSAAILVTGAAQTSPRAVTLKIWDVENDIRLTADVTLDARAPELSVSLRGEGSMPEMIAFPHPFVTPAATTLAIPMNEGILFPVGDKTVQGIRLSTYSGHGICMPWFGAYEPTTGAGVMEIIRTPDDAQVDITRDGQPGLYIRTLWESQRGKVGYERKLTYCFFAKGGYVAQAKRYRRYAQQSGLFKTLAQKRAENPNVDKLIGAANVWNWDRENVALCKDMKRLGMDRVLWSNGGSPEELAAINALGYLTGRYDIYQDVFPPEAPNWASKVGWPEDLVWLPNGDWMKGWADYVKQPDGKTVIYQGGVICSPRGLARAKQMIPADLKTHPYGARFIDTTTATPWRECYNPAHPLTRSDDRKYKMALLEFCSRDEKQVVGTETGIDPSVPYVHYYEGMLSLGPYRLPDAGRDMEKYKPPTPDFLKYQVGHFYRAPLWELVYHDCVVSMWYWGDYNNKAPEVWKQRDLFNILYGTPPMYMFSKDTWNSEKARFAQSYADICPLVRRLGYQEMVAHEFVTPDHAVQSSIWKDGTRVYVNFGDKPYRVGGAEVKPLGWLVRPAGRTSGATSAAIAKGGSAR